MRETNVIFVLGDTLPTHYDVAISLFSVATKPGSAKMKDTINKYTNTLIEIWEKSFGSKHVMRRKAVVGRLEKLALNYYNKVYNIANRTEHNIKMIKQNQPRYDSSTNSGKPHR